MPYRVALVYNLKRKDKENLPLDYFSEFDSEETINAIAQALRSQGNEVFFVEADETLITQLKNHDPDIVFNIAEGKRGKDREAQVPAILDFLGLPYTGSGPLTLALALNKTMTKKIFQAEGIPTPNFQLFSDPEEKLKPALKFPLIVKPNREGSAKGILASSVVHDEKRLYEEVYRIFKNYSQEALVEEYIDGQEVTVGILENGCFKILPILEIDFSNCQKSGEFFYSWRMKEFQGDLSQHLNPTFYCPARLDTKLAKKIEKIALACHRVLGCFDLSRTDIRIDKKGRPYVLEINPLPGLSPYESNLTFMTRAAGIAYEELICGILKSASRRYCLKESIFLKNTLKEGGF
jgi:D-alanine-D-alanine ligase